MTKIPGQSPAPYPDDLARCCRDTLRQSGPVDPTDGVELPCDWCMNVLKFEGGRWVLHRWTYDGAPPKIQP